MERLDAEPDFDLIFNVFHEIEMDKLDGEPDFMITEVTLIGESAFYANDFTELKVWSTSGKARTKPPGFMSKTAPSGHGNKA